jgi:hypothetical protein
MNIDEIKESARNFIVDKGWDLLLMEAYLTTRHFIAWSDRDDFQERWNIGVKNIYGVTRPVDIGYVNDEAEFLCGEIAGINFQLGGVMDYDSMPDGDSFNTANISLFVEGRRVMAVRYTFSSLDTYFAEDYRIFCVEEFHNDEIIGRLLFSLHNGKIEQEKRGVELDRIKEEEKYRGKFSF